MIPLPNLSGGPASSQSGDARGGATGGTNIGGIAPVIIGGFKSDGSASAFQGGPLLIVGAIVVAALIFLAFRR